MKPRSLLFGLILLSFLARSAGAADWGIYGATICAAPGDRSTSTPWSLAAPDGEGGAYMGWSDNRSGTARIFLQRVTSGGGPAAGWAFHGIPVTPWIPDRQYGPALAADPAGGVFMVWLEGEERWEAPYPVLRVTRLGADGSPKASWPAAGVTVTTTAHSNSIPAVEPDASGGAYVMWVGSTSAQAYAIYLHHVLGDGTLDPSWPAGALIVGQSVDPLNPALAPDGQDGVLLAWDESRYPEDGIRYRAQRILVNGSPAPGWDPDGVLIQTTSTPNNTWRAPKITADGNGGAVVSFREFKNGEQHYGLYARRVASNGQFVAGWAAAGTPVATTPPAVGRSTLVSDGAGGAILFWESLEEGAGVFPPWRVWAQRLDANGSVASGWPSDGRRIGAADRFADKPVAVADGAGGAFVTWSDHDETGFERLRVHHVKSDASNAGGWGADGAELAPGSPIDHSQVDASSVFDGSQGIFAFWSDAAYPATEVKVLGQRFDPAPPTGVGPSPGPITNGLSVHPNPAFATATVRVRLQAAARVSVAVHDLAGRRVRTLAEPSLVAAGETPWTWDLRDDDGRRVAPGVYRMVARRDDGVDTAPVVVLR